MIDIENVKQEILCDANAISYTFYGANTPSEYTIKGYARYLIKNNMTVNTYNSLNINSEEFYIDMLQTFPIDKLLFRSYSVRREAKYLDIYISGDALITQELIHDGGFKIYITSPLEEDVIKLIELQKRYPIQTKNTAYTITQNGPNLSISSIGSICSPLIDINYTPNVIEDYKYTAAQLESENPNGRLAIFYGPPGSGKTHLIKALISELTQAKVIVFPSSLVSSLDGPALISLFFSEQEKDSNSKRKPIVLVIEDADDSLTKRTSNNMSSISAILNTADGILGTCLDLRIVATTNAKEFEIDEALLRTGRLLSCINIDMLPSDQCSIVYKNITNKEKTFDKPTILSDIYAEANKSIFMSKFSKPEKKMGFM